jgi:2'-5' RNA ligase
VTSARKKIAVDVVLLPDEKMTAGAIGLNKTLSETTSGKIALNRDNCLPHISLAMGCIEENYLPEIREILREIAGKFPVKKLKATEINIQTNSLGEQVSLLGVEKTEQLKLLHETVMEKLEIFFTYDVTADMLLSEKVAPTTLLWIGNYRRNSSFESFYPHITIGYGKASDIELPREFEICRLALCHLGNHCTCKKVLFSSEMI